MSNGLHDFSLLLELKPRDARKYAKLLLKIQRKFRSADRYGSFSKKIFKSKRYSYEIKQKLAMDLSSKLIMPQLLGTVGFSSSRSWGVSNLAGEALFVFILENLKQNLGMLNLTEAQQLVKNPAFISSMGSEHNSVELIFSVLTGYRNYENELRQQLVNELVISPHMNSDIAELVFRSTAQQGWHWVQARWISGESPMIEWVRKNYDFDSSMPDTWVRQFLVGA